MQKQYTLVISKYSHLKKMAQYGAQDVKLVAKSKSIKSSINYRLIIYIFIHRNGRKTHKRDISTRTEKKKTK